MRFKTVFFDLDGTLMDHLKAIHRCYCHTLPRLGLPAPSVEQVRGAIGGGLENAMSKLVPADKLQQGLDIFRPYWDQTMLEGAELMPGSRELLEWLNAQGCVCAVFSNKHGPSGRRLMEHFGVAHLLKRTYGAKDTPWLKPQAEFAAHAMKDLGALAGETLMIGDSPFDVQAARNGGFAASWCVTTGTHSKEELEEAGATRVFSGMFAILDALKKEA
jgi:phosphoglycolate phosphatase